MLTFSSTVIARWTKKSSPANIGAASVKSPTSPFLATQLQKIISMIWTYDYERVRQKKILRSLLIIAKYKIINVVKKKIIIPFNRILNDLLLT